MINISLLCAQRQQLKITEWCIILVLLYNTSPNFLAHAEILCIGAVLVLFCLCYVGFAMSFLHKIDRAPLT